MEGIRQTGNNNRYLPDIKLPKSITACLTLEEALENTKDCLIVVPSHGFKELLVSMKPFISASYRIAWATKGLEPVKGLFLNQVVMDVLGQDRSCAVLSGPSFAKEVAHGLPTAVTVASNDASFLKAVATYFHNDVFSIYTTDDLIGVQLGGVVKNILAVAAGISEGLGFGSNAVAALITRGLAEMMSLGEALGAKRETLMGLAGCGDVILTCTDNQSRNRRLGLALAKGLTETEAAEQIGQAVEAVHNVTQIYRLAKEKHVEMPIAEQVFRIMKEGASPREAVISLFDRSPQSEKFGK